MFGLVFNWGYDLLPSKFNNTIFFYKKSFDISTTSRQDIALQDKGFNQGVGHRAQGMAYLIYYI